MHKIRLTPRTRTHRCTHVNSVSQVACQRLALDETIVRIALTSSRPKDAAKRFFSLSRRKAWADSGRTLQ